MATPGSSWRSAPEDARTPTREYAQRAGWRRGREGSRGAVPAARLPAGQERPGRVGVAPTRKLGGGPLQCSGSNQRGHREDGVGRPRGRRRGRVPVKKTHDYIHHYRGYWSEGGKCRIRIYREEGQYPVVICSQLADNPNTSVTNMAEYLAAEV